MLHALVFEKIYKVFKEIIFFKKLPFVTSFDLFALTPNSIGFICHTYVTTGYDMVTVECIESKKSEGQTNIQTNKQTREPLSKGEQPPGSVQKNSFIKPLKNHSLIFYFDLNS